MGEHTMCGSSSIEPEIVCPEHFNFGDSRGTKMKIIIFSASESKKRNNAHRPRLNRCKTAPFQVGKGPLCKVSFLSRYTRCPSCFPCCRGTGSPPILTRKSPISPQAERSGGNARAIVPVVKKRGRPTMAGRP